MVADVVVSAAKSFPDPTTLALVSDVQFREPYSSGALNRKFRGIVNPGIYGGFTPSPAGGLTLQITSDSEGGTASINIDKYYQLTVRQQAGVSLSLTAGKTSIVVLEATYVVGQETYQVNANSAIQAAEIKLLEEGALLNENQLELCTVKIPAGATEITDDMIDVTNRKLVTLGINLSNDYESDAEDVAITPKGVKEGLAKKQPLDTTLSELSGKTVAELLEYLRLGEAAKRNVGTGTNQIPDMGSFYSIKTGSYLVQKNPSGLIEQWFNSAEADATGVAVANYPLAFPNKVIGVFCGELTASTIGGSSGVTWWGECYDVRTLTSTKIRNGTPTRESCIVYVVGY
nr:hypothetical protein [Pseudocitrobacter sp. RIT 415]